MEAGLPHRVVAEVSATDLLVRVVAAGLGWTILPWSAVGDEVRRGLVDALPIRRRRLSREVSVCVSDTVPLSRATEVVRAGLLDVVDELLVAGAWTGAERVAQRPSSISVA